MVVKFTILVPYSVFLSTLKSLNFPFGYKKVDTLNDRTSQAPGTNLGIFGANKKWWIKNLGPDRKACFLP